ncbi:hypothetical protein BVX95_01895, partial [archaeon D22]
AYTFIKTILKADVGTGIVANSAYNNGRPYFSTFRPIYHSVERLKDSEIEKYADFNERIETIEYRLKILAENKVDVFDYNLELNLALKKLMIGGFNMVQIYLEGLEARIKSAFDKLKMELPEMKVELVDEDLINKSISIAKELSEAELEKEIEVEAEENI